MGKRWPLANSGMAAFLGLILAGCGGGYPNSNPTPQPPTPTPQSEFLYATSIDGITVFPVNPVTGEVGSGRLVASGFTSLAFLSNIVTDPTGKFLFVCGSGDSIDAFSVNSTTGDLALVSGSPLPLQGTGLGNLSLDPSGKFLYAATTTGIAAYKLGHTPGTLSAIPGSPFSDGSVLRASVVDPSGKFLYASGNTTEITLSVFAIDSDSGVLTPLPGSPFPSPIDSEAYNIAIHPSGKFLYVRYPFVNSIEAWSIDSSSGGLALIPGTPFPTGNGLSDLLFEPSGKFLYTLNSNDGTVSGFSVDASGALATLTDAPFAVSQGTGYLAMEPLGQYVYAANGANNIIAGFGFNPLSGALAPFNTQPVPAQNATLLVVVKPTP